MKCKKEEYSQFVDQQHRSRMLKLRQHSAEMLRSVHITYICMYVKILCFIVWFGCCWCCIVLQHFALGGVRSIVLPFKQSDWRAEQQSHCRSRCRIWLALDDLLQWQQLNNSAQTQFPLYTGLTSCFFHKVLAATTQAIAQPCTMYTLCMAVYVCMYIGKWNHRVRYGVCNPHIWD